MNEVNVRALITLKAHRNELRWQQYRTLRGQVLAGDSEGAIKGLQRILRKQKERGEK